MRCIDVDLHIAVYKVKLALEAADLSPGADRWTSVEKDRWNIFLQVIALYPDLSCHPDVQNGRSPMDMVMAAFIHQRKAPVNKLICERIIKDGKRCFWDDRVESPCNGDLTVERLVPGDRNGAYHIGNIVVACARHNSERGKLDVESFLRLNSKNIKATPDDGFDNINTD